jgi:hypothetical protein
MVSDAEFWQAFVEWCEKAIADRYRELVSLEEGTATVGRKVHGSEWVDVTRERAHQIRNEIASLKSVIVRKKRTDP